MAQPQTTTEHRSQLWSGRIASWKQSGLTQRAYCERHQLVYSTFAYWRGRLKKLHASHGQAGKVNFLPVTLVQENPSCWTIDLLEYRGYAKLSPGRYTSYKPDRGPFNVR